MCGCVEHMPVVSRSDCTQTNLEEYYTFTKKYDDTGFTGVVDRIKLAYQACQGANNNNNDLTAFVQQLVNDGKLTTEHQDIYSQRVVGNHQCNNAITDVLASHEFEKGFNVNASKWTYIVGEQFDDEEPIYNARLFKEMFEAQPEEFRIVRRVCPTCSESHRDIYYKRLTPMPDDFDLLDTLMNNWFDEDNELDVDFSLYSTYMDAYYDENRWTFCNFNNPRIGFPYECGPTGKVHNNWNSYIHGGGHANHHAFMIPSNSTFESSIINIAPQGTASQISTSHGGVAERAIDGNTVGVWNFGSTTHTHTTSDPYWQLDYDYEVTFNTVYFWNRLDCCGEHLNGAVVSVIDRYTEETVTSITFDSAQVMNVANFDGAVGHALRISIPGSSKILSLAEVEVDGVLGTPVSGNVKVEYFYAEWNILGDFDSMDSYKEDTLWKIDYDDNGGRNFATSDRTDNVAALFKGFMNFDEEGTYKLCVNSDDGSKVYVRNQLVINNDGLHGPVEKCADIDGSFGSGIYSVRVEFFERGGGALCTLKWQPPSSDSLVVVPPSAWVDSAILPPTATPTQSPTHDYSVRVKYYAIPSWTNLPADGFNDDGSNGITFISSERVQDINMNDSGSTGSFGGSGRGDQVGATFEGLLEFKTAGEYEICINSDDGSKLYLDGDLLINNDGLHGDRRECITDTFTVGQREVFVEFFENGGGATCYVSWKKPLDESVTLVPPDSWLPFD